MDHIFSDYGNMVLTTLAVGLSCGSACSPLIPLFLTMYTMSGFIGLKKGLASFGCFVLGKTGTILLLSVLSAVLGRTLVGQTGRVAGVDLRLISDFCMILTGLFLLIRLWFPSKKNGCAVCGNGNGCNKTNELNSATSKLPVILAGAAYALTPCAPLLMLLTFASMMNPLQALGLGLVFSIVSSFSPLIIFTAVSGFFARKMYQQIPQLIRIFQWNVFVLLIVAGGVSLWMRLR
jgi:hypothetical protein